MARRQTEGAETWRRLLSWDRGQTPSERLAAHILRFEGYTSIDPSHPLGGPDGLKDILCARDGKKWIGAAYFPRGQQSFSDIQPKFKDDLKGVSKNAAQGIAFVTNQELSLGEREQLIRGASPVEVDLFHLERIASILDSPACYGIRLDYLDIEMTKEEQLAFIAVRDQIIGGLQQHLGRIASYISRSEILKEEFEKISTADVPKEPFYVTPVPLSNPWGAALPLFQERLHKCSNCGYGYFVRSPEARATIDLVGPHMSITCPNCGNVEKHYFPFF